MASRGAAHGASIARRRLRKSARRDILPSFFLLAALSLVPTGASARSVTDACFWDPSDGTCSASATWVSENNLIHSKRGQFMARVLVAYEECALATNEGARCESLVGTCDWRAGSTEGTGECNLSARWMTKELQGCLSGDGAGADPLVQELLDVSVNCIDKSTNKDACDGMKGRCQWTDSLADGVPSFCGPNPLHAAQALLGIDGLVKVAMAVSECPKKTDEGSCDAGGDSLGCDWIDGTCAVSIVKTLKESLKSPSVVEYFTLLEQCGNGEEGKAQCAAAGDTTVSCIYGPKRLSTNIVPTQYGGDGGDGQGGWEGLVPGDGGTEGNEPMSCYPSYMYVAEKVAPLLGLSAGEDGACALAEPAFRIAQVCDAAKDAGACDATDFCTWDAVKAACLVDVDEAIKDLLPESDAHPVEAMEDVCEGADTSEACSGKSADAESAARNAGADVDDDDDDDDDAVDGAGTAGAYFVIAGFAVFAICFAAPANYVNFAYKRKGKDVCDDLPAWAHRFVPPHLRPEGMEYVQVTDNPDPDMNVDEL
jgi:hypothetical protein